MKKTIFILLLTAISFVTPIILVVKNVKFNQNCAGYLKQTADANTVDLAISRLNMALDYIEANNLTEGYTSVLWKTEADNIDFWYQNLKSCQMELKDGINGTQLEKTNLLMKVRESLVDTDSGGTTLTIPHGISRYPNNAIWAILNTISMLIWVALIGYGVNVIVE